MHIQKLSLLPHRGDWNFLGAGGYCKTPKVTEMCEALLEFPEGLGEVWIFSGITNYRYMSDPANVLIGQKPFFW